MDDTICGLEGVVHICDDFTVHGATKSPHDAHLRAFLRRVAEAGLTFCLKKCCIGMPEIKVFFCIIFNAKDTSLALSKIEKMSQSEDASEVRSLLGMAQYSAQYIPNLQTLQPH